MFILTVTLVKTTKNVRKLIKVSKKIEKIKKRLIHKKIVSTDITEISLPIITLKILYYCLVGRKKDECQFTK